MGSMVIFQGRDQRYFTNGNGGNDWKIGQPQASLLTKTAPDHAEDMAKRDFYGHDPPEGKSLTDRYQALGGDRRPTGLARWRSSRVD